MPITVPLSDYAPTPPQIVRERIPLVEHPAMFHILDLLGSLGRYERQFRLALMLFQLAWEENSRLAEALPLGAVDWRTLDLSTNTLNGWQMMAARDGALAIYHFGQARKAVSASLGLCPILRDMVDHPKMRISRKLFDSNFPSYDAIRHAVGHIADFSATINRRMTHSIKGPWKGDFGAVALEIKDVNAVSRFADNLYQDTYCVTYLGRVHRYDMTAKTLGKLEQVRALVYSSFEQATMPNP
jgi:hypothetical protein